MLEAHIVGGPLGVEGAQQGRARGQSTGKNVVQFTQEYMEGGESVLFLLCPYARESRLPKLSAFEGVIHAFDISAQVDLSTGVGICCA